MVDLVVLRFVILCVLCALAVNDLPAARLKSGQTHILITAWTQEGAPLRAGDVTARIDGKPVRVTDVRGPSDGLMLLVVTDFTEDLALADSARQALVLAVEQLPPNVYAGLLRAQDGPKVVVDPTPDRKALAAAILEAPVSGNAALLSTVETVLSLADSVLAKSRVRVAVLYVTDSNVRNYREDYTNPVINYSDSRDMSRRFPEGLINEKIATLEGRLSAVEAPLFVVHLDYRSDRLNEAYQAGLKQLAAATGGAGVFCRSRGEIPEAITRMLGTIVSHHGVMLELPERAKRLVQIQLEGPSGALNHRARFNLEGR